MGKVLATLTTLFLSSCGFFDSALEREYKELEKKIASTSAQAEELYKEAEAFVSRVGQFENPPQDMIDKARALQQKRARDFAKAAAQNWEVGSARKVWNALRGAKLDPKSEAAAAGIPAEELPVENKCSVNLQSDEIPAGCK